LNRIDRLHAILTHLQSKKRVTAQEIADRFNISLRTVYRDVKALDESGVPVIGEAGTGYTIMEGYRLPPVMFTQEEAAALMMGSKLAERLTDASVKKYYDAALFKIKAVLRGTDKEHVENLDDHIAVMISTRNPTEESANQYLAALQKAIVDKKAIFLRYNSNNEETTERVVEPIGLCYYSANWHLIGWCRMRNDYRDFRVGRIQRLQIKEESFANKTHQSLQQYLDTVMSAYNLYEVVVRVNRKVLKYIKEQKYYYGFVREEDAGDFVRMWFVTGSFESFGRWLLTYTDCVIAESPDQLLTCMQKFVDEINSVYTVQSSGHSL
jgi:predicted DNA-binding transcriptional regulator YafY